MYVEYNHRKFSLPNKHFITNFGSKYIVNKEIVLNHEKILYKKFCLRLHMSSRFFDYCCVLNCVNIDIQVHSIFKLYRVHQIKNDFIVSRNRGKRVRGLAAILSILNRNYILFCSKHHSEFEADKFSPLCCKTIKFMLGANLRNLNFKNLF